MYRGKLINICLIAVLLLGLSLVLYPSLSNYLNRRNSVSVIENYVERVTVTENEGRSETLVAADEYNARLYEKETVDYELDEEEYAEYESQLRLADTSVMAYIEIPKIDVTVPVYHGTEESVMQVGAGHLEWTSLPVGGENTHCVISGHRGLPSAKLFTDLDRIVVGDVFYIHVLDEVLTYEVDQILTVLPDETDALMICEGMDLCTLMTCTPYGVNSHRLLVRGVRVPDAEDENDAEESIEPIPVSSNAMLTDPLLTTVIVAIPLVAVYLISLLVYDNNKTKRRKKKKRGGK